MATAATTKAAPKRHANPKPKALSGTMDTYVHGADGKVTGKLVRVGKSGQVSIGKRYAGENYAVEINSDGSVLLKRVTIVPAEQAWTQDPDLKRRLGLADKWMADNPPAETDLSAIIAKLDAA